ncbi:Fic family protein [Clavibacter michiganensis subsp. michiganensis]|uniref:Fic/DOC family protein n=1 Tax=Clavibacter michiganensis TaxID=28447 RepID=UPI00235F3320|nr:Fic family protein [Clavibacter michiganensis]WDD28541.1 Fic family protein [Clavibacter michiganensis subsp. michiganensis]
MSVDDKYTYPGSGGVLINAAGIRDHAELDEAMNDVASFVLAKIYTEPVPARLDLEYLRGIHVRMFGDLLPAIAGRIRDVDVQATGTGIPYCRPDFIEANLDTLFRKLEREDYLTGLDADTFTERLADRWGELSAIHPWRDGNTRSQSMYVAALAQRAGHPIDWARIDVDELRHHRLQAIAGTDRPLADYLRAHLIDTAPTRGPEGAAPLSAARTAGREQGASRDAGEVPAYSRRELAEREMLRTAGIDPDERSAPHRGSSSTSARSHEPQRARGDDALER